MQTVLLRSDDWRVVRRALDIPLPELAAATGVSLAIVKNYSNGRTTPPQAWIDQVWDLLARRAAA